MRLVMVQGHNSQGSVLGHLMMDRKVTGVKCKGHREEMKGEGRLAESEALAAGLYLGCSQLEASPFSGSVDILEIA
jgi:hypothetical protein